MGLLTRLLDSIKRRICDWIDFALLGLPAFIIANNTSLRQRLGDLWAGTVVVDVPQKRELNLRMKQQVCKNNCQSTTVNSIRLITYSCLFFLLPFITRGQNLGQDPWTAFPVMRNS